MYKEKNKNKAYEEESQTVDFCYEMKINCTALQIVDITHEDYRAYQKITLYSVIFI